MITEKIFRLEMQSYELIPIIYDNGKEYDVPGTIVGEKVKVQINDDKKNPRLKVLEILEKSPDRITPKCPIFEQCGGCTLLHISYERQLKEKTELVKRIFLKETGLNLKVPLCLGMDNPYNYRNKSQIVFKNDPKKKLICGFYQPRTHNVVEYTRCLVQDELADEIVETIKKNMLEYKINAYNEDTQKGVIRHVLIKRSFETKQTMVVLVTANMKLPREKDFIKKLLEAHPEITTIIQNINDSQTSMVLGEKEYVHYGNGYILDILMGKKFLVTSKSFYQVNPYQTEVLYKTALSMANLSKNDVLLDAYSGVGTIGIIASSMVKKVISVEIVEETIKAATGNAKINNVNNIQFKNQDATKFMLESAKRDLKIDVVLLDPPRRGCGELFMNAIVTLNVNKVIYISCNPLTQAKDIMKLLKNGYVVTNVQPVDLFPHTSHVENILILEKKTRS